MSAPPPPPPAGDPAYQGSSSGAAEQPQGQAQQPHIEAESGAEGSGSDGDSAFGSEAATETTSLASTILNYEYENGRRYHSFRKGTYVLPNDETEQDRLDIWHHIELLLLKGKLTHAPLVNPQRILDVGTGTGIWAIDAADTWPSAEITGSDLSPIQPRWVPPNCKFEVDDMEAKWVYPENYFDLVHIRYMLGSIKDWDEFLQQAFLHTVPGGYIEVKEAVLDMHSQLGATHVPSAITTYFSTLHSAADKSGRSMRGVEALASKVRAAGFDDVDVRVEQLPVGTWARDKRLAEIGAFTQMAHMEGFKSYGMALFTRVVGMKADEAERFIGDTTREIANKKLQLYTLRYGIVARKPVLEA